MNYQSLSPKCLSGLQRQVIGLDLDDESGIRLVSLELDGKGSAPPLRDHRRFQGLDQLKSYWAKHVNCADVRVAVSLQNNDSHKVLPWIRYQGAGIDRHSHPEWKWTSLRLKDEFAMWSPDLPKVYQHAYTLAFLSAYRTQAATITSQLCTCAVGLREMLTEFEDELRRLAAALPERQDTPGETPF